MNFDRIIAVCNDKTVYRDSESVVKVFDDTYAKSEVLSEALTQALVEESSLSVPKVLGVGIIDNKWYIASEYIPGKTLAQLMEEDPDEKDKFLDVFVDIQLEMHAKSCPNLQKLEDKITLWISDTSLDAKTKHELQTRLASMPKQNRICHGDFHPSNVIIRGDGTPFLLDWSHAAQGSTAADAASTYLLFLLDGDIDGAKRYLNLFCERSGTDSESVQKWLPLVAAGKMAKANERKRKFLKLWIDGVEHE